MANHGFVYILGNEYMPDLIKIGCTERSPHARAEELSKPTAVPTPFQVLCYIEVEDFQAVERSMHEWCKDWRVNPSREFFHGCLTWAVRLMYFHPRRLSFTDCTAAPLHPLMSELVMRVTEDEEVYLSDMRNPFSKPKEESKDEQEAQTEEAANDDESEEAA